MKTHLLSVVTIASSLSVAPLALALPALPTSGSLNYKSYSDSIYLSTDSYGQGSLYLSASSYDTKNGEPSGSLYVSYYSPGNLGGISIYCSSAAVARFTSVTPGGVARVKGSVDANTPGCSAYSYGNIPSGTPVTVDISGKPNGTHSAVYEGSVVATSLGTTFKSRNKTYEFSEDFSGTISVYPNLSFAIAGQGTAYAGRSSYQQ